MASRYSPTHSCGHMGKPMPDTASSRAYAAEHVETALCWSCERFEANERAQSYARQLGYPELVGKSAKQSDYGIACRDMIRLRFDDLLSQAPSWEPYADAALYGITDAGWWIDRREEPAESVLSWVQPIVDQVRASLS